MPEVVGVGRGEARFEMHRPDADLQERADWYERRYEDAIAERDAALEQARRLEAAALATRMDASEHERALAKALELLLDATRARAASPRVMLARTRARAALDRLERARRPPAPARESGHRLAGELPRDRRRPGAGAMRPATSR
jgi:hypothetical protein